MSKLSEKCPEYYRTSGGREFWEFFRDECYPAIVETYLFSPSQTHALESACEYLFRAGVKTIDLKADILKAFSLIERAIDMEADAEAKRLVAAMISETVGRVMLERMRKIVGPFPLADPIVTAWGRIDAVEKDGAL